MMNTQQYVVVRGYFAGLAGCTGVGPGGVGLIGASGGVGVTSAPASFAALKVVPGGVGGGRRSMIRLVWFTTNKMAIEATASIAAMTAGFWRTIPISVNGCRGCEVPLCRVLLMRKKSQEIATKQVSV